MGVIKDHFDKICTDAIRRYGKKRKVAAPDELQVLIYLADGESVPPESGFMLLKNFEGLEPLTAKQLADTKLDFLGKAAFLEVKTAEILQELCIEHHIRWQEVRVIIELKKERVITHLYRDQEYIAQLDMETILSDEKMMVENG